MQSPGFLAVVDYTFCKTLTFNEIDHVTGSVQARIVPVYVCLRARLPWEKEEGRRKKERGTTTVSMKHVLFVLSRLHDVIELIDSMTSLNLFDLSYVCDAGLN